MSALTLPEMALQPLPASDLCFLLKKADSLIQLAVDGEDLHADQPDLTDIRDAFIQLLCFHNKYESIDLPQSPFDTVWFAMKLVLVPTSTAERASIAAAGEVTLPELWHAMDADRFWVDLILRLGEARDEHAFFENRLFHQLQQIEGDFTESIGLGHLPYALHAASHFSGFSNLCCFLIEHVEVVRFVPQPRLAADAERVRKFLSHQVRHKSHGPLFERKYMRYTIFNHLPCGIVALYQKRQSAQASSSTPTKVAMTCALEDGPLEALMKQSNARPSFKKDGDGWAQMNTKSRNAALLAYWSHWFNQFTKPDMWQRYCVPWCDIGHPARVLEFIQHPHRFNRPSLPRLLQVGTTHWLLRVDDEALFCESLEVALVLWMSHAGAMYSGVTEDGVVLPCMRDFE